MGAKKTLASLKNKGFTRGVLLFATNNDAVDYVKMALLCASLVKKHLNVPVTLVTDPWWNTLDIVTKNQQIFDSTFDKVIVISNDDPVNSRAYRDTQYHSVTADFKNGNRLSAYELSPYDETIVLDVDYLVLSDNLNKLWGSPHDFHISRDATRINHQKLIGKEYRLNDYGIRMVWATVLYFKKNKFSKLIFDMVAHIKEHWDYYHLVYDFPDGLYRNDYAFSIALHTLGGALEEATVPGLPGDTIYTLLDRDQIYTATPSSWQLFINDDVETWKFTSTLWHGIDLHCLNKLSLLRVTNSLLASLHDNYLPT